MSTTSAAAAVGSGTSFRHRLLKQQAQGLHIQTQNLPFPLPQQDRAEPWSPGSGPSTPRVMPPVSPRVINSAAVVTGQSRFVEGSMNDRVSTAPPPGFLGFEPDDDDDDDDDSDEYEAAARDSEERKRREDSRERAAAAAAGRLKRFQRHQQRMSESDARAGSGSGAAGTTSGLNHLRRPKSTAAGWLGQSAQSEQQQRAGGNGVVKKTSFLAPLWDGVREKLQHLNKSKSSGSIGRMVNLVGERKSSGEKAAKAELEKHQSSSSSTTAYPSREEVLESYRNLVASGFFEAHAIRGGRHPLRVPGGNTTSNNGNGPASPTGSKSFADHMAASPPVSPSAASFAEQISSLSSRDSSNLPSVSGRSFADRMAARQQEEQQQQQQQKQQRFSAPPAPIRPMDPPPLPPVRASSTSAASSSSSSRISRQIPRALLPGHHRGTKRAPSLDLAADAEMVKRKLVKKLRYSASRMSADLPRSNRASSSSSGQRARHQHSHSYSGGYGGGYSAGRTSTSSDRLAPLSPTESVFSHISIASTSAAAAPAPVPVAVEVDETKSLKQHRKLTKSRRRILGIRRTRSPSPSKSTVVNGSERRSGEVEMQDADAMMLDEPELPPTHHHQQHQQQQDEEPKVILVPGPKSATPAATIPIPISTSTSSRNSSKQHRNITPPPATFFRPHHGHHQDTQPQRKHHEPLSILPDPNQGIPQLPRIPREFCDAMGALAPPVPATTVTTIVNTNTASDVSLATVGSVASVAAGSVGGEHERGVIGLAISTPSVSNSFNEKMDGLVLGGVAGGGNRDSGLGGGKGEEDVENIPVWG
ncbi:hypothetical protein VTJ04DRAFT_9259 [Mycothermus thermophilus]|uniref:uncharacterized protein n=1 Tax=Humicola insolens TaxID=85995 RepID=UPI0037423C79